MDLSKAISQSHIDYILGSSACAFSDFSVIEPDINFSDHLPLLPLLRFVLTRHLIRKELLMKSGGALSRVICVGIKRTVLVTTDILGTIWLH